MLFLQFIFWNMSCDVFIPVIFEFNLFSFSTCLDYQLCIVTLIDLHGNKNVNGQLWRQPISHGYC